MRNEIFQTRLRHTHTGLRLRVGVRTLSQRTLTLSRSIVKHELLATDSRESVKERGDLNRKCRDGKKKFAHPDRVGSFSPTHSHTVHRSIVKHDLLSNRFERISEGKKGEPTTRKQEIFVCLTEREDSGVHALNHRALKRLVPWRISLSI